MHDLEFYKLFYTAQENLMRYHSFWITLIHQPVLVNFDVTTFFANLRLFLTQQQPKSQFLSRFSAKSRFWVVSQGTNHGANTKPNPNPSNPFRMVLICIQMNGISFEVFKMHRITFECFEYGFQCFESRSNGLNFDSNASNPFRMV